MFKVRFSIGNRAIRGASRRGMSLIEAAAAISACMILMSATLTALIAVQHADRRQANDRYSWLGTNQLVDRLRDDLHACQSFVWNDSDRTLRLTTAAGEITLERAAGRWLRTDAAGVKTAYRRPAGQQLRVEPAAGASGDVAKLQLYSTQKAPPDEIDEVVASELTAEIGRDARLLIK